MSDKKNDVILQFRADSELLAELHALVGQRAAKIKRRVTLSDIIRACIFYGKGVVEAENSDEHFPLVLQKSHTQAARDIAISALTLTIKDLENAEKY